MKFGVFDHMDRAGGPLGAQYQDRLALIEAYDRAGFYAYHVAEHHSTPLGMARPRACSWQRLRCARAACGLGRWSISFRSIIRCG